MPVRPAEPGLVGRDRQLAAVRAGLVRARAGDTALLLVHGGPGSGKTALLDACAVAVEASVRRVTCGPDVVSAIATLLADAPDRPGTPPSCRYPDHVRTLTATGPLVLLLDDAHRCDPGSVEVLDLLVRRGSGLLVVAAVAAVGGIGARPPGWGVVAPRCQPLDLPPLDLPDVAELVRRRWQRPGDEAFVAACLRGAGGNPLALRMILDRVGNGPPVAGRATAVLAAGCAVLAELLPGRLAQHTEETRAVSEAVAVLGRTDAESIAMLAGVSETVVASAFAALCADGVLGVADLDTLRAALLADLPPARLRWWHARAARLLADAGRPAGEIAAHLLALPEVGEPWMRAILREAAATAPDRDTAACYLDHALAADPVDVPTLVDYVRTAGEADPHTAHRLLRAGLERTTGVRERAELAIELAWLTPAAAGAPSVVPTLAAALADLDATLGVRPTGPDRELRVRGEAARLAAGWTRPPVTAGGPVPAGDTPAERDLLALRAFTDMLTARAADVAAARATAALAEPGTLRWPHAAAAYALAVAGDVPAALTGLDRVLASAGPTGWTRTLAGMLRALVLADAGDAPAAVADAERAVTAMDSVDTARVALATAHVRQGDLAAAVRVLPETDPDVPVLGHPLSLVVRAAAAEDAGDLDGALTHLNRCGAVLTELGVENPLVAPWWVAAARLLAATGRSTAAADLAAEGADAAARWGTGNGRGLALFAAGTVELAQDPKAGRDVLAEAVELLETGAAAWYLALAELALGEAALRTGDRVGARKVFRAAADGAVRCGYRGVAVQARARLVAAGGRVHRVPGGTDTLTHAERRVAELATAGATNREIADRLLITVRTVETHLTSLYRKLGVAGRSALHVAIMERDRS
ncbi:helix-turn-helix transcriptional regulator [Actinophytocola oryzae]|uniref:ATP/maltotriose-dependent transcriptional regulator MalT n=1 Tax=Actinophytocola oryzae TaxID=502181 RepID=A0A4R7VFG6_9PSEU|nr:LuxR family transcriptional regulator [Actinophytocola oryzae]TDV47984.1 ATP/maltotriose-dependent transcriptional regulator MalT [Actinophytocola oryzae]